ncbi:MAG: flavin reductase family protein [Saprospiraceae bacterium]
MKILDPTLMGIKEISNFLTSAVVPRPIAFVSTINEQGIPNLSPFSFFNVFSSDPVILIFSAAKSALTGQQKHTYLNAKQNKECVIHIANFSMVEQLSVTSGLYPHGVNEFEKGGFEAIASTLVKPPRVKVAPIAFECNVDQIIELGDKGGAGNLIICRALLIHVDDQILDEKGNVITEKLDPIARLGYNNYIKVTSDSIFTSPKPTKSLGIGADAIPNWIHSLHILNGNEIGKLAGIASLPDKNEVLEHRELVKKIPPDDLNKLLLIQSLLHDNLVKEAWMVILYRH